LAFIVIVSTGSW